MASLRTDPLLHSGTKGSYLVRSRDLGLVARNVVYGHAIHVTEAEIELMGRRKVGRRFRAAQTDWRGGVVAVGRRARNVLARRAQSALGDPRLGLVVFHLRRWGPVDYRRGDSSVITEPYRRALIPPKRRRSEEVGFAYDSALEGNGFELVPRHESSGFPTHSGSITLAIKSPGSGWFADLPLEGAGSNPRSRVSRSALF